MNQSMFRSEAGGQADVWGELGDVWAKKGVPWKEADWEQPWARDALFSRRTSALQRRESMDALWTILRSESGRLVWKLQCEKVIRKRGENLTQAQNAAW
ncbi:hypothetical protein DICSQDRAFT_67272 [Dichomitus squalens LYAD-421 SS1]|uniref:Uncharacterized protein n=1 Tax=Dichomitus squalens (strain LYAD-421) TaxID=732165 RepID=R7SQB1_DICSQ|nr:uncharacterized protein DICSQDRAFT_67272 [Dichomitus squalens LYAD-421 SS1]EJF58261.1 hypothetical protein DICSQDRAFT_67272 [Dichomitus squalens LYAD-421 SS1]